jgi:type IV pilus assembly protein PilE
MHAHKHARLSRGFTLIELMIVVVIATILLSIAVPLYMTQTRQARRVEAKTALLDLAGREERFFSTNGSLYTATPASLGYTGFGVGNPIGSGYYYLTVCASTVAGATPACDPNAGAPVYPSYYIIATPIAGKSQANDTQCTSFAVDSTGAQFATGSQNAAFCWSN